MIRDLLIDVGAEIFSETYSLIKINCVFHTETEGSLVVYKEESEKFGYFKCFGCGKFGSIKRLLSQGFNKMNFEVEYLIKKYLNKKNILQYDYIKKTNDVDRTKVRIPEDYVESLKQVRKGIIHPDYKRKNLLYKNWLRFGIGWVIKDRYRFFSKSIIIPLINDNKLRALISRSIENDGSNKYKYTPKVSISHFLFNYDMLNGDKKVMLLEGAFDAISVYEKLKKTRYNDIVPLSLFTNTISNLQIQRLKDKNVKDVYVCLDNDDKVNKKGERENAGQTGARKVIKRLKKLDINIYNLRLPVNKDVDEITKKEFLEVLENKEIIKEI